MVVPTRPACELSPEYDAVVVGSGYGGGVAASRLARMGFHVAVLEQGRLWKLGDFPTTNKARRKTTRISGRNLRTGDPTGLYRLSVGKGITVFAATGLGGGSLINAGVVLRPDFQRLLDEGWPEAVISDGHLVEGLARAEEMLGVAPVHDPERFAKYTGMRKAALAAGKRAQLPSMTISHRPGINPAGVFQQACQQCGDCWSGCNAGAKNTVGITYIADAANYGAEVFCKSRVESIAQKDEGWEVVVQDLSDGGECHRTTARMLILGAGTLGTNELMLRARNDGLAVSEKLGESFSANGDDMVIASELDDPVNAVATGYPTQAPNGHPPVGPHSMALIDLKDDTGPLWLHDGTMLTMMAGLAPLKAMLEGKVGRALDLFKGGPYGERLQRSQVYYIVGHDDAGGRLRLHRDQVMVDWPEYSNGATRVAAEEKIKTVIERMGGTFQKNPFDLTAFGGNRIIAHPLGGCGMGETVEDGVVAPDGRVFDPRKGSKGVYEGLYICDGAAIPTSVGVSPLLTITGLAERVMMLAAKRLGRKLDVSTAPARERKEALLVPGE